MLVSVEQSYNQCYNNIKLNIIYFIGITPEPWKLEREKVRIGRGSGTNQNYRQIDNKMSIFFSGIQCYNRIIMKNCTSSMN